MTFQAGAIPIRILNGTGRILRATGWDEKKEDSAVFQFQGKRWASDVDRENGNFDYLMGADVDLNNREVVEELIRWGRWYLDKTRVNGFRMDAVKHIDF